MEDSKNGTAVARHWSPQKYIELVDQTTNPTLREFQDSELGYITTKIQSPQDKVFIDVGAGYGRVLPHLTTTAGRVIAVEIDGEMLIELRMRAEHLKAEGKKVEVVAGDANNLSTLLERQDLTRPVFLILQNTLGTWKGDYHKVLEEVKKLAEERQGEVIVSLLNQERLKDEGIPMYKSLQKMVGEADLEACDFEGGYFRSKKNDKGEFYQSHWWRPEERAEMMRLLGGHLVGEVKTPSFHIFHTKYS